MPTYHYRCTACAHEFDEFQSMKDKSLETCPKCQGVIIRVISGGAGVIFKGSGFYQTDYRSDSYNKAAKADTPGGATPAPDSGAKKTESASPSSAAPASSTSAPPASSSNTKSSSDKKKN